MLILARRLLRTISGTMGQFLAVTAVITVGVAVYVAMTTAFNNLSTAKENFYDSCNFANYYFHAVKAPEEITKQIGRLPGVARVTGRIQIDLPLVKPNGERATARVTSYPSPVEEQVNALQILTGRMFTDNATGSTEVLVDPQHFAANNLSLYDPVTVIVEGKPIELTVVGTATSPEFIYPMQDAASLVPEPETFAVVMLPHRRAQQILNNTGQINQVVIETYPGVDEKQLAGQVEKILEPYGNLASYPRKQQLSHAALQAELDGLKATSRSLPLIFFGMAAAIQCVMLGRMIKSQRQQIGILKALGYANRDVMAYYTCYAVAAAAAGALAGSIAGIMLSEVISRTYARFFNLPAAIGSINYEAAAGGLVISLLVSLTAGLFASRQAASISPAESMRPAPPAGGGRSLLERWGRLWRSLSAAWKMSLRGMERNRLRFLVTVTGIAFAVGLLVIALFTSDAIEYLLYKHYHEQQRYDYLVRFSAPVKNHELLNISRLEGIIKTEPLLEVPVRLNYQGQEVEDVLVGLPAGATLKRVTGAGDKPLPLPEEGVLLDRKTADKLGVHPGDTLEVKTLLGTGPNRHSQLQVAGIAEQYISGGSYTSLEQANRVLRERNVVAGAMLKVDRGLAGKVEKELQKMTGISSLLSRHKELQNFEQNLDSMIYFTAVMVGFALLLGFAIVYNAVIIGFSERQRELAILKVMGYTNREVSGHLLRETLVQAAVGIAAGLPFGRLLVQGYARALENDLYSFPLYIHPQSYVVSALAALVFVAAAFLLTARRVRAIDPVQVLKNRD